MNIQEVILQTASLHKTKQFYTKTLGLPAAKETNDSITFKAGDTLLTFNAVSGQKPVYHLAFNITNNKFSDSFEWINNKLDVLNTDNGLPIAVYPDWNAESFYFLDNNGSILEFIVRFDLPYYSPDPFSVADIKEISEVGVVSNDVTATALELSEKYGIPYFPKSKPAENFTVLGDNKGLLIITKAGRGWIPTNKPTQIFPLTIIADDKTLVL